jgi:hypothetical protein
MRGWWQRTVAFGLPTLAALALIAFFAPQDTAQAANCSGFTNTLGAGAGINNGVQPGPDSLNCVGNILGADTGNGNGNSGNAGGTGHATILYNVVHEDTTTPGSGSASGNGTLTGGGVTIGNGYAEIIGNIIYGDESGAQNGAAENIVNNVNDSAEAHVLYNAIYGTGSGS